MEIVVKRVKIPIGKDIFMNKISLASIIVCFLIMINACNIYRDKVNNKVYSINFIDYNMKYEIDIDHDGEMDSVRFLLMQMAM